MSLRKFNFREISIKNFTYTSIQHLLNFFVSASFIQSPCFGIPYLAWLNCYDINKVKKYNFIISLHNDGNNYVNLLIIYLLFVLFAAYMAWFFEMEKILELERFYLFPLARTLLPWSLDYKFFM
jgi:hypothetical protein